MTDSSGPRCWFLDEPSLLAVGQPVAGLVAGLVAVLVSPVDRVREQRANHISYPLSTDEVWMRGVYVSQLCLGDVSRPRNCLQLAYLDNIRDHDLGRPHTIPQELVDHFEHTAKRTHHRRGRQ